MSDEVPMKCSKCNREIPVYDDGYSGAIDCLECEEEFCANCYDVKKGDDCRSHAGEPKQGRLPDWSA